MLGTERTRVAAVAPYWGVVGKPGGLRGGDRAAAVGEVTEALGGVLGTSEGAAVLAEGLGGVASRGVS